MTGTSHKWRIPADNFDPESDEWRLVVFCCPDTPDWRQTAVGAITEMAYGRNWDGRTGSIKNAQMIAEQIGASIDMNCGEKLERIAVALESMQPDVSLAANAINDWYDSTHIDILEIKQLMEAAGLGKWLFWTDILGEVADAINLLPDVAIKYPVNELFRLLTESVWRMQVLTHLGAHNITHQTLVTSQFGPSITTVLDGLLDAIPADDVLRAVLGDAETTIQKIGTDLITLISGNYVTNRLDDIAENLETSDIIAPESLADVVDRLVATIEGGNRQQLQSVFVQCGCSYGEYEPAPPGITGEEGTAPDGYTMPDQNPLDYRCLAAQVFIDDLIALITTLEDQNFTAVLPLGTAAVASALSYALATSLAISGPIGWGVLAIGSFAGLITALFLDNLDLLDLIADLESARTDIVCAIYTADTNDGAKTAFDQVIDSAPMNASQKALIKAIGGVSALTATFYPPETQKASMDEKIAALADPYDCALCTGEPAFVFDPTTVSGTGPVEDMGQQWVTLTSEFNSGPGSHVIILVVDGLDKTQLPANDGLPCANIAAGHLPFRVAYDPAFVDPEGRSAWFCSSGNVVQFKGGVTPPTDQDYDQSWYLYFDGTSQFQIWVTSNPALFGNPPA